MLLDQAFVDANPTRKVVKSWAMAKIKEIAHWGVTGWVISREHPPLQMSQDQAAAEERAATPAPACTAAEAAPAATQPSDAGKGGLTLPMSVLREIRFWSL